MNNHGRITVFLCLLISSMLLLGLETVRMTNLYMAKGRIPMSARTAVSGIKAEYNSYIYEHYHILLFDKSFGGRGEAYLEELVQSNMQENLGSDYTVEEVMATDFTMLTDADCRAFKEQIADYIKYAAVCYGAEQILAATGGRDGTLPEEVQVQLDNARQEAETAESGTPESETAESETPGSQTVESGTEGASEEDPRDFSDKLENAGLLTLIVPEDMEFSDRVLTQEERVSLRYTGVFGDMFSVNNSFDSYNDLKKDLQGHSTWKESLIDGGTGLAYAATVFNCATDRTANDTAVLGCELEYLICGRESDSENMKETVNKLIAIRLPINYAYLLTDAKKEGELKSLAWSLFLATGIPEPILKHLLAGAWAYVEAVAEVRNLLRGNRMAFMKNSDNWITDLGNLEESVYGEGVTDEQGLSYKDYLLILLSLRMDDAYYRMMDIMGLNAGQEDKNFSIEHAAVAFSTDIRVSYGGRAICVTEYASY